MSNTKEERIVEVVLRGQQANASLKEMEASARGLRAQLRNLTPGTQEFIDKTKNLKQINSRLKKINDDVKGVGGVFSKIGGEIKAFGILAAGYLGFDFITSKIKNIIGQNAKLSDSFADIQKTTGMTEKEVRNLNKALGQINTRTSGDELRKIAVAAGQLGIAKTDILKFADATDKLVVSLGDEFAGGAEEVTKQMGGLRNSFLDIKTDNIADDMLHIGNAINSLGSSGSATGPVIADFANRIGGVGITMGLTSGQVLGLSATLQELNVSTERGGTAVVKILQKMTTDTDSFAKVAGMSTKEFTALLNKDLYGAFVKVAAGAKAQGSSATALAKILDTLGVEGAGASEVFAKLGNNTDLLKRRVDLATQSLQGTNSIMSEFNTKNTNMAADLDRIGKGFSRWFANSTISDGLKSITGWVAKLFDNTQKVSSAMDEERVNVQLLVEELKSTNASQERRVAIYEELKAINPDIVKGIDQENISMAKLTENVRLYNEVQIKRIVIQQKQEKIDETQKVAAEKYNELLDAQKLALIDFEKTRELSGNTALKAKKILDDETTSISDKIRALEKLGEQEKLMISDGRRTTNILKNRYSYDQVLLKESQYQKAIQQTTDLINDKNDAYNKLGLSSVDNAKKEIDYTKLSADQLNKYIQDAKNSMGAYHNEEATLAKQELDRRNKAASESIIIDEETQRKLLDARKKYLEDLKKLDEEYTLSFMTKQEQEEYKIFKKYDDLFAQSKKFHFGEKQLLLDRSNELQQLYSDQLQDYKELYKDQEFTDVQHFLKTGELLKKTAKQDVGLKKTYDQTYYTEANADYKAFLAAMGATKRAFLDEDLSAEDDNWSKILSKKLKVFQTYQSQINQIISLFNKSEDNAAEARKIAIDKNAKAELDTQKKLLDGKVISEQQYQKRIDKINAQAEKNKLDIERKEAQRKKTAGIFNAIINTAVGVTEAIPNPLKMALALGMGAIEIGLIASQPIPYAKGGMTSFADGGEVNRPYVALAGEAGREWIGPNWMVESPIYGPTIQALEQVRSRGPSGGGSAISNSVERPHVPSQSAKITSDNSHLVAAINRLNDHLDAGVIAKLDFDGYQKDLSRIENAKK